MSHTPHSFMCYNCYFVTSGTSTIPPLHKKFFLRKICVGHKKAVSLHAGCVQNKITTQYHEEDYIYHCCLCCSFIICKR